MVRKFYQSTCLSVFSTTDSHYKVIITFVEEIGETEEIRYFTAQTNSFKFWEDEREDIYQDYLALS